MNHFQSTEDLRKFSKYTIIALFILNFYNLAGTNYIRYFIFILTNIILIIIYQMRKTILKNASTHLLELKKQEEQLIKESRLAEIGKMMGAITHEIYNPISIIKTQALRGIMLLEKNNNTDIDTHVKIYQTVVSNTERTGTIIQNIKKILSNSNAPEENSAFPIKKLLDQAFSFMEIKTKKAAIKIECQVDENEMVSGNFSQLEYVFLNLISNAVYAIQDQVNPWIRIQYRVDNDFYYVTTIDSGNGISDEYLSKIEKGYFTTKDNGEGSGQGLMLCKKILKNHGGELYYVKGENTTFEIKLPKLAVT